MLFLIPTAAVATAALLLLPVLHAKSQVQARRRVRVNACVFLVAVVLLAAMAIGVSAAPEAAPAEEEPAAV